MPARVLITRAPQQGSELADRLRAFGADPVLIPAIEIVEPTSFATLDAALAELSSFHWLLFTSANAVESFAKRLERLSQQQPIPKVAAIGPATARALQAISLTPRLVPPQAVAECLAGALLPHARQPNGTATRFLLVRAEEAREHLPETLRGAGGEVTVAPAYRTVIPAASVELIRGLFPPAADSQVTHEIATSSRMGGALSPCPRQPFIDAVTFTSSSTARNLVALCDAAEVTLPESALRVSIGPITSQTLRDLGLPPHAEAPEATVTSLAETLMTVLRKRQP